MKNFYIRALLWFILPAVVIFILLSLNILWGALAVLIYFSIVYYKNRVTIMTYRASVKYTSGNTAMAFLLFEKAYRTGKMSPSAVSSYAYVLLKERQSEVSEKILTSHINSLRSEDDKNQAKSILALVFWKKNQIDEALALLESIVESYKNTNVYGSLGYLLLLKGDLDKALTFNLKAYEYNSSDKIIQDNLGQTYLALGELGKAKEIYEPLINSNPTFPEAYYNYGLLLEKLDEPENAKEQFNKALSAKFSFLSTLTKEQVLEKVNQA